MIVYAYTCSEYRPNNITNYSDIYHLICDRSREEQWISLPEDLNVSRDKIEGNIEIRGKRNSLFLKGPVIKRFVI